MTFKNWSRSLR